MEISPHSKEELTQLEDSKPEFVCSKPIRILGVQDSSPLAWSSDGARLAFVSGNRCIYISIRDVSGSWIIESVLTGHIYQVTSLAFHPKDPVLISGGLEGIFVWDWQKAKLLKKIETNAENAHESGVECLLWVYNGSTLLSGARDSLIKVWDALNDFALLETIQAHKAPVLCAAFCRNTNTLATAGRDSSVKLWDVSSLDVSFREKRADDSSIKVAQLANLDGHRGDVTSLLFSQKGDTLFSGARDNEIKVWDIATGTELRCIKGHRGDVRAMFFVRKEGILLTASADSTVKFWQLISQKVANADSSLTDLLEEDSVSEVVDPAEERDKLLGALEAHEYEISHMALAESTNIIATSDVHSHLKIWDISDPNSVKQIHEFVGHKEKITSLALVHQDQRFLSASIDYNIFFFDIRTQRREGSWNFGASVSVVATSPDQTLLLAGGSTYEIKGYCLAADVPETFVEVANFVGHSGKVEALAVSPDGSLLASGGHDFNIYLWALSPKYSLKGGEPVKVKPHSRIDAHRGHVTCLAFSEKGDFMASSSTDHGIALWAVSGRRVRQVWEYGSAHESVVASVCFGKKGSGHLLVSSSWDSTVKVWDTKQNSKGVPLRTMRGHSGRVTDVKSTADGRYVVSSGADCTIRLWALAEPFNCIVKYLAPTSEGAFSCVSAGEKIFVSGSENGMLRVWPLLSEDYQDLFTKAK